MTHIKIFHHNMVLRFLVSDSRCFAFNTSFLPILPQASSIISSSEKLFCRAGNFRFSALRLLVCKQSENSEKRSVNGHMSQCVGDLWGKVYTVGLFTMWS